MQPFQFFSAKEKLLSQRWTVGTAMTFLIPLLFDVWTACPVLYCQHFNLFLRGHRKLEDFLPSHRSCCAVLSQVLSFPGNFSKLFIGVQKTMGPRGGKEDSVLQYECYSTGILWYFEAGNLPIVQEIRRCMFCDTDSTFFGWAHFRAGTSMGKVGKRDFGIFQRIPRKKPRGNLKSEESLSISIPKPATESKRNAKRLVTEANVHFPRLGEKFVSLLGGHWWSGLSNDEDAHGGCVCRTVRLL